MNIEKTSTELAVMRGAPDRAEAIKKVLKTLDLEIERLNSELRFYKNEAQNALSLLTNKKQSNFFNKDCIERIGFTQAMNGNELWVNTETDEIVKFVVKDLQTCRKYYCRDVKVTIELLPKTEE